MNGRSWMAAAAMSLALGGGAYAAEPIVDTGEVVVGPVQDLPWFASVKLGVALPGTIGVDSPAFVDPVFGALPGFSGGATFNAGFAGVLAFGKYLTPQMRVGLEGAVASNTANNFNGNFTGGFGPLAGAMSGSVTTVSLAVLGTYEFRQFGAFVPHLTAGGGLANISANSLAVAGQPGSINGNSISAIGRLGAGFDYAVTESLSIGLNYDLLVGTRARLTYTNPFITRTVNADVLGHALTIGIKGTF